MTVGAGPVAAFKVTRSGGDQPLPFLGAGVPYPGRVTARDAWGHVCTEYAGVVTLTSAAWTAPVCVPVGLGVDALSGARAATVAGPGFADGVLITPLFTGSAYSLAAGDGRTMTRRAIGRSSAAVYRRAWRPGV